MYSVIQPTLAEFAQPNSLQIWHRAFRLALAIQAARELDMTTPQALVTSIAAKSQEAAHIHRMFNSPTSHVGQWSRTDKRVSIKSRHHTPAPSRPHRAHRISRQRQLPPPAAVPALPRPRQKRALVQLSRRQVPLQQPRKRLQP
jgi:hypothetical protein